MTGNRNVLVLLSGGIDSSALLDFYIRKNFTVSALFVDYGQMSSAKEYNAAKQISSYYETELRCIEVQGLPSWGYGCITGRNGMLLQVALMVLKNQPGSIAIGIHSGTEYADCTKLFTRKMQAIFDLYTSGQTSIGVPFIDFNKMEIWQYCKTYQVPVEMTYSCETGLNQPCGICSSCRDLEVLYAL